MSSFSITELQWKIQYYKYNHIKNPRGKLEPEGFPGMEEACLQQDVDVDGF
jgi:hypothetical protein